MKTLKYILALTSVYAFGAVAQEESKECKEYKVIASDSKVMGDFQEAASYYWKIEKNCNADDKIYINLRYCYEMLLNKTTDETRKVGLRDTLIVIYGLQEQKYGKDATWSIWHAYYLTANKSTNYTKIDELFSYAIGQLQEKTDASFISTYYYNLMMMYNTEKVASKKEAYSKRIIDEYISLQKLLKKIEGSERVQEYVTAIFNGVAKTCDDVTPVLQKVLNSLPQEKEAKIEALRNYMTILENKGCSNTKLYADYSDTLLVLQPSASAYMAKGIAAADKKQYNVAIELFRKAMSYDDADKDELNYRIAFAQYGLNQYKVAYNTAMTVGGEYKSKALSLAASCVAALANSCGDTTFERKANYWYAVELAERAGVSSASYRANCPTSQDIFNENKERGGSIYLSCWGVTVKMNPYN
jgi:hypothetical protein